MLGRTVALLVLFTAAPVQAGFFTGNQLLEACASDPELARGYAMANIDVSERTVVVAADGTLISPMKLVCAPTVTATQVRDLLCKYLKDHPENRQWDADILAEAAFHEAWPCS